MVSSGIIPGVQFDRHLKFKAWVKAKDYRLRHRLRTRLRARLGRHRIGKWLRLGLRLGLRPSKMSIESPPRTLQTRTKLCLTVKQL